MYVVIEDLTDLEKKLGLTKEIVEARVFAVLRKNGLKPVEGKPEAPHFYNVNIKVVGNACAINVGVMREVTINNGIGDPPPFLATTWNLNSLGDLGTNSSSGMDSILDRVSSLTEQFANEFLKANGK